MPAAAAATATHARTRSGEEKRREREREKKGAAHRSGEKYQTNVYDALLSNCPLHDSSSLSLDAFSKKLLKRKNIDRFLAKKEKERERTLIFSHPFKFVYQGMNDQKNIDRKNIERMQKRKEKMLCSTFYIATHF